jgi:hypothetical protein
MYIYNADCTLLLYCFYLRILANDSAGRNFYRQRLLLRYNELHYY